MATYKKRGYKAKEVKIETTEEVEFNEQDSTTAEVFNTLEESASKSEEWVSKNQNYILGVIAVIAVAVLGYLAFEQFVKQPKEAEAGNEMFYAMQYYNQALQSETAKDSLYNLALNGANGKYGLIDVIDNYSGTQNANLATYAAGMSFLNTQKYTEAIDYLENYSSDDIVTNAMAKGAIGDAFMQLNQPEDALGYYEKAASANANDFTTPMFLQKAGVTALELGDKSAALNYFERIKEEFASSTEANLVDAYIAMAKN
ncbi:tetratricopeptide repeat protein [Cellulophaga baltica]|uniref:tetratricopeptide repeat protein n=1 Tax=Cellulophaga TaxID=104264 RepID=UPI001C071447|nr:MULTISPECIES: tetratricopeptide repeat protein [Cellulophaga]MBU2996503.1 tetratricopeptide repeat protein [Cellulophaga baltica]MDO6767897.1 tetratricopeptide repeat protein [Cellulophaga sp. 1_MG-2023]